MRTGNPPEARSIRPAISVARRQRRSGLPGGRPGGVLGRGQHRQAAQGRSHGCPTIWCSELVQAHAHARFGTRQRTMRLSVTFRTLGPVISLAFPLIARAHAGQAALQPWPCRPDAFYESASCLLRRDDRFAPATCRRVRAETTSRSRISAPPACVSRADPRCAHATFEWGDQIRRVGMSHRRDGGRTRPLSAGSTSIAVGAGRLRPLACIATWLSADRSLGRGWRVREARLLAARRRGRLRASPSRAATGTSRRASGSGRSRRAPPRACRRTPACRPRAG